MFVSENSSSKNFVNFQEKHPLESAFLPGIYWECSRGKFKTFSEQLSQKTPANGGFCIVTEKHSTKIFFFKKYLIQFFSFMF